LYETQAAGLSLSHVFHAVVYTTLTSFTHTPTSTKGSDCVALILNSCAKSHAQSLVISD